MIELLLKHFKLHQIRVKRFLRNIRYAFGTKRCCPVCNKKSKKFAKFGLVPRDGAQCIWCGALERHRLGMLYCIKKTNLLDKQPKQVLHVAPARCFEKPFAKHIGEGYVTADIENPRAMVKMDITDIHYSDESFDVIYCSHVLEHVTDDKKAMRELLRVLKSGGWAILLVPITVDKTFEDPSISEPAERLKVFGNKYHVRRYGSDFIDRLRNAGFKVTKTTASDFLTQDEIIYFGVAHAAVDIFYCTK